MQFDRHTLVLLVRRPDAPELTDEVAAELQDRHLAYRADLRDRGYLIGGGPLVDQDDERLRGISIMMCDPETARRLSKEDQAVGQSARGRGDDLDGSRGQRPLRGRARAAVDGRGGGGLTTAFTEFYPRWAIPYDGVLFDLFSGLLNSQPAYDEVAGSASLGSRWRGEHSRLSYSAGDYRPLKDLVAEAAERIGLSRDRAPALVARLGELRPWPEAPAVLAQLRATVKIGVVTNCSDEVGRLAAAQVGVPFDVVATAEVAGAYKPRPEPYRLALEALDVNAARTLFVAGSPDDIAGADRVGMPVYWRDRTVASIAAAAPGRLSSTIPSPRFSTRLPPGTNPPRRGHGWTTRLPERLRRRQLDSAHAARIRGRACRRRGPESALDAIERGELDRGPGPRPGRVRPSSAQPEEDSPARFLGWADEVDAEELFESGRAWGISLRRIPSQEA